MTKLLLALCVFAFAGCASPGATMSPGLVAYKDDFDGSTIVRQTPIGAGSSSTEDWSVLGFEWKSKFPDRVVITAGTKGVVKVTEVTLEVEGEPIRSLKAASEFTDHGDPATGQRLSTRRFEMSWVDFERTATAKSVQMKVVGANEIFVTSFGAAHVGAAVNSAFPSFLATVRKLRGEAVE